MSRDPATLAQPGCVVGRLCGTRLCTATVTVVFSPSTFGVSPPTWRPPAEAFGRLPREGAIGHLGLHRFADSPTLLRHVAGSGRSFPDLTAFALIPIPKETLFLPIPLRHTDLMTVQTKIRFPVKPFHRVVRGFWAIFCSPYIIWCKFVIWAPAAASFDRRARSGDIECHAVERWLARLSLSHKELYWSANSRT